MILTTNNEDNICIICLEEIEYIIIFNCTHSICLVCYEKLLNIESNEILCPLCRDVIEIHEFHSDSDSEIDIDREEIEHQNQNINNHNIQIREHVINLCNFIIGNIIIVIIIIYL